MKLLATFLAVLYFANFTASATISDRLTSFATKRLKKSLNEAHAELKENNVKIIEAAFFNVTSYRWKFSRIERHFSKDPSHKDLSSAEFLEKLKSVSKDKLEEMEKLMDAEFQNKVSSQALDEYSDELETIMMEIFSEHSDRINKCKITCLINKFKSEFQEKEDEYKDTIEKFMGEAKESLEDKISINMRKMDLVEHTVSTKYESCFKSDDFEGCLEKFIQNEKVQKLPEVLKNIMSKLGQNFMDALTQVGPSKDRIKEIINTDFNDDIDRTLKECTIN